MTKPARISIALFTFLFSFLNGYSQIVDIPDPNFKHQLVNLMCVDNDGDGFYESSVDFNDDGEIQVSEAEQVLRLHTYGGTFEYSSAVGIEAFVNLEWFITSGQNFNEVDLTSNTNLVHLNIGYSDLEVLDISTCLDLEYLECHTNNVAQLDLSQHTKLTFINLSNNPISEVDLSNSPDLEHIILGNTNLSGPYDFSHCENLIRLHGGWTEISELNIKNGNNEAIQQMSMGYNFVLGCVQVDDADYARDNPSWYIEPNAYYSEQCNLGVGSTDYIDFSIHPVPANNNLYLNSQGQIGDIKVFSVNGVAMYSSHNESNIDVSSLSTGVYFIQVTIDGQPIVKRFIKK